MKQLVLIGLLLIGSVAARAQIFNHDMAPFIGCPVEVRGFCYDPFSCVRMPNCSSVVVWMGATAPLPSCGCPPPMQQGYEVKFATCASSTVELGDGTCYPVEDRIPAAGCEQCDGRARFDGLTLHIFD